MAATSPASITTPVDIIIRVEVVGTPADVENCRRALNCLADVMAVQAEDGLWSLGHEDAENDDGPSEIVANIMSTKVHAVLIGAASREEPAAMATVTDHEDMTAKIVFAFSDALRILRSTEYGSEAYENAMETAFAVALKYGWDHAQDDSFYAWCLKATHEEICVEGMVKALANCRPQVQP